MEKGYTVTSEPINELQKNIIVCNYSFVNEIKLRASVSSDWKGVSEYIIGVWKIKEKNEILDQVYKILNN